MRIFRAALTSLLAVVGLLVLTTATASAADTLKLDARPADGSYFFSIGLYLSNASHTQSYFQGSSQWNDRTEVVEACDDNVTTYHVRTDFSYPDADTPKHHLVSLTDTSGGSSCVTQKVSLPEGTPVKIRGCVTSYGCSKWYDTRA